MFEKWKSQYLYRQYIKESQKNFFLPQTYSFESVLRNVRGWVEFAEQDSPRRDAIPLLDFLICTVKEDLRTSVAAELLYAANNHPRDWNYFSGAYYPEIHLIVMDNGLHHSCAAAAYQADGEMELNVYSLEHLFPNVTTDGELWYLKDTPCRTQPVLNVRMAILFELARMKFHLENAN